METNFSRRGPPVSAAPRFIDDSPAHNKVLALPFLGISKQFAAAETHPLPPDLAVSSHKWTLVFEDFAPTCSEEYSGGFSHQ